ncbi:helix-turn-helix transcriptional regulator [Mucisphaera calidilacus]|uniref:Helix-turn-helix domain-containing protein n=1 Tax=Mucisphaera calidilacus TaxID=2527982 RepID=A0A518C0N5_9BACT|nr:hypothetical protein [Mucisphaera calidilacus]QDU72767.1 hypothetical protein Pan265_26410 [Mucisphaera calidilacus]
MPQAWVTIQQAAQALGVSTSTIRRRIARSMLDVRVETDGRKKVRIPADEPTTPDSPEEAIEQLFDPEHAQTFAPGDLLADTAPSDAPEAHRYQRLAGAAVVLAQRQTDEAHDKVRLLNEQNQRLRKLFFTSSAIFASILTLSLLMLWSSSSAAGAAEQQALTLRQKLSDTQIQLNTLTGNLTPNDFNTPPSHHSLSQIPTTP